MPSYVEFSEQGADMSSLAVIVDAVDGMSTPYLVLPGRPEFWPIINSSKSANAYNSREGTRNALWRTLVGDRSQVGCSGPIPLDG
jgi:hypothetical protein